MISTRYGKANNKYICDEYNVTKPIKYITYLDASKTQNQFLKKRLI